MRKIPFASQNCFQHTAVCYVRHLIHRDPDSCVYFIHTLVVIFLRIVAVAQSDDIPNVNHYQGCDWFSSFR